MYGAVPKWRSPFTQAVLSWIGAILGVFEVVPLWKIIEPFLDMFRKGSTAPLAGAHTILWSTALVVVVVMHALVWSLRGLTKRETRRSLRLSWSISGYNHRVTLEKVKVSHCPSCDGKMKYYMKPTGWYNQNSNGWMRRVVTERTSMLGCLRNPKHVFEVDPAEGKVR